MASQPNSISDELLRLIREKPFPVNQRGIKLTFLALLLGVLFIGGLITLSLLHEMHIRLASSHFLFDFGHRGFLFACLLAAAALIVTLAILLRVLHQQQELEEELRAKITLNESMRLAFVDAGIATDSTGRIVNVNPAALAFFGFARCEMLNAAPPYPFWLDRTTKDSTLTDDGSYPAESTKGKQTFLARRKDGTVFVCKVSAAPFTDEKGRRIGWLRIYRDVTELTRAREELLFAYERAMRVLDALSVGISVTAQREKPQTLFVNSFYARHFGRNTLSHQNLRNLAIAQGGLQGLHNGTEIFEPERERWLLVRASQLVWPSGQKAEMLTVADVTATHQAEQMLSQQRKTAEHLSRLITMGEMASSIAHELNQPLAAVQNYAAGANLLLHSGRLTQENLEDALRKIEGQAQRAGLIMKRIRDFARRSTPQFEPAAVNSIVDDTLELAQISARRFGMQVVVEQEPGLPAVLCDSVMISQVLVNLLRNAMQACVNAQDKTISLTISSQAPGSVTFAVSDHGPGVPAEMKKRLFEPFFSTKKTGLGIGLNICRSIIERHHGRLLCEDNPGGGARFRFSLAAASIPLTKEKNESNHVAANSLVPVKNC